MGSEVPTYDFITEQGNTFSREMTRDEFMDLPMDGNRIMLDGVPVRRHIELPDAQVNVADHKWFKPGPDSSMPRRCPGFKHDNRGRPIVESISQLNAYRKATGMVWVDRED